MVPKVCNFLGLTMPCVRGATDTSDALAVQLSWFGQAGNKRPLDSQAQGHPLIMWPWTIATFLNV